MNPNVGIGIGWTGHNKEEAWREAEYLRGSGTDTLVFGYTVTPGDNDDKGVAIFMGHPNKGYGGDGTIKAEGTDVEINPYYLGSGNQSAQKVDTTPPRIDSVAIVSNPSNGEAYDVGETVGLRSRVQRKSHRRRSTPHQRRCRRQNPIRHAPAPGSCVNPRIRRLRTLPIPSPSR